MNYRSCSSPSGVLRPPAWVRGTVRCRRGKNKYYTVDTLQNIIPILTRCISNHGPKFSKPYSFLLYVMSTNTYFVVGGVSSSCFLYTLSSVRLDQCSETPILEVVEHA